MKAMSNKSSPKCPVASTMDIMNGRWTPLILRDLLIHGARRFQDFQDSLTNITPAMLSARLKTLEQHGIIMRHFYTQHPPRAEYILTEKGCSLGPIIDAMRKWGIKYEL